MPSPPAPASQPVLPDETLEEIFLRLDAAADLARASSACTTFRRVVSARRFLRRFRSLHPPPLLGFLDSNVPGGFHPADPPHRSAPAARALAQAADFNFSFLGGTPDCWRVCDTRDGRVLLYRASNTASCKDLVVCDPLHRRHVQLPPIPSDALAAAAGPWGIQRFDSFLDPATDKEKEEQDLSFRVICVVHCRHKLVTFRFASVTGKWSGITFDRSTLLDYPVTLRGLFEHHYWMFSSLGTLFILDTREMKCSVFELPPSKYSPRYHKAWAIVEVAEGRLGFVDVSDGIFELYSKTLGNKNNGAEAEEWQHDKTIPLPQIDCRWSILHAAVGHLLLQATLYPSRFPDPESHYFTLDLKTLLVERLCVSNQLVIGAYLYASFPPSLSPPSI